MIFNALTAFTIYGAATVIKSYMSFLSITSGATITIVSSKILDIVVELVASKH